MKIYLSDIEDVIVCECGIVYEKEKICVKKDKDSGIKKGECRVCKKELIDYSD